MENLLRESSEFICLLVILIQTVFKSGSNYYLQECQECKYAIKKRKIRVYIYDKEDALEKNSDRKRIKQKRTKRRRIKKNFQEDSSEKN